ncbi:alpha/beta hydrolase [Deinococcus roseus]|uniref:Transporter n=1 Tax=Deinococcus roseus TaxID=392414 RepID=A0ABQ2D723_9DEIO|nr:alpha/beta hydrolase [Deinococcus roseus]GGJ48354.1 transporter [Deinococcus roseus]
MKKSPHPRRKNRFTAGHFAAIVGIVTAVAVSSSNGKAAAWTETPCNFGAELPAAVGHTLSCGTIEVPAKHSEPQGKKYQLHFALYKSTSEHRKADPIIVLNGGPGQKTASIAPLANYLVAAIAPERDLVLFDQRGVGAFQPSLDCPQAMDRLRGMALNTIHEQTETMIKELNVCFDDLEKQGVDLGTFNTVESADDVADLARALSDEKVNLYGVSYGSRLAQEVMRRHPEVLRSVLLDAVVSTDVNYMQNREGTVDAAFRKSLSRCAQDEACNAVFPNLLERIEQLADRLDQNPIKVQVPDMATGSMKEVAVTSEILGGGLMIGLYSTQLVPVLPALIDDLDRGNTESLSMLVQSVQMLTGTSSLGMQVSFACNDLISYARPEDLQTEHPLKLVRASFGDVLNAYSEICAARTWNPIPAETRQVVKSDVPTLLFSGELDPVTPPHYAQQVLTGLSHAQLIQFPAGAHGEVSMMPGGCADGLVVDFFNDPSSKLEASCASVLQPYVLKL